MGGKSPSWSLSDLSNLLTIYNSHFQFAYIPSLPWLNYETLHRSCFSQYFFFLLTCSRPLPLHDKWRWLTTAKREKWWAATLYHDCCDQICFELIQSFYNLSLPSHHFHNHMHFHYLCFINCITSNLKLCRAVIRKSQSYKSRVGN